MLELQKAALLNPLLQRSELYVTNAYEQWQSPFKTHLISDRQMAQIADTKTRKASWHWCRCRMRLSRHLSQANAPSTA